MLDDDEGNIENVPVVQTYQVPAEKNRSKFLSIVELRITISRPREQIQCLTLNLVPAFMPVSSFKHILFLLEFHRLIVEWLEHTQLQLNQELQRFISSNKCKKKSTEKMVKNDVVLQNCMYPAHLFILRIVKLGHTAPISQER